MQTSKEQVAKAAITAALLVVLWATYCFTFAHSEGLDFRIFYSGADMLRRGAGPHLYEAALTREFQLRYFGGSGLAFISPPLTALLFFPFALTSIQVAYSLWTALSMALLVLSAVLLNRSLHVFRDSTWLLLLSFVLLPVHFNMIQGQLDTVILLAYVLTLMLLRSEKPLWAGLMLSVGLVKFHLVIPMAAIMLFRRQGRFLLGFAAGCALAVAITLLVFGGDVLFAYVRFLTRLHSLSNVGIDARSMPNIRGALYMLLGHDPNILLLAAISLGLLGWAASCWQDIEHGFAFALVTVLLTSYHANPHDLTLLVIPLAVWIRNLKWLSWRGLSYASVGLPPFAWIAAQVHHFAVMVIPLLVFMVLFRSKVSDLESTTPRPTLTAVSTGS